MDSLFWLDFPVEACIGCCPEHFVIQILDLWNKCELFKPVWSDMFLSAHVSQSAQQHQFLLSSELRSLHTESKIFSCVFPFFYFSYSSSVPIKMHSTDAKMQKIEPDANFFLWRTNVSEAVFKRDWHNVRSYLFFNMQKFQTAMTFTLLL